MGTRKVRRKKNIQSYSTQWLLLRGCVYPKNTRPSIAYLPSRIFPKIHATKNKIYFFINFIL
jgi:hypothetical protein